jgi:hypothetical protein
MPTPLLRGLEVVGIHYRPDEVKARINAFPQGSAIEATLRAEPTNPHDPHAVAVDIDGIHIGYIPKTVSAMVALALGQHLHVVAEFPGRGKVALTVDIKD